MASINSQITSAARRQLRPLNYVVSGPQRIDPQIGIHPVKKIMVVVREQRKELYHWQWLINKGVDHLEFPDFSTVGQPGMVDY